MAMVRMETVQPPLDSSKLLSSPAKLRKRAKEDGYLFFRKLLCPDLVFEARKATLNICAKYDWLAPGSDITSGLAKPGIRITEGSNPRWQLFYQDVQKLRVFHSLALELPILKVFEVLFGEPVLPHSRNIFRLVFPNTETHSTPPHQDNYFIGGSDETWTTWIPYGDCPRELGGLAVNRGSHTSGKLETTEAVGPGRRKVKVQDPSAWVSGDYVCGDVIMVHSLTVHQGKDNLTSNRIRISADYRYQPRSHSIREDSLQPHMNWLDWDDIYSKWELTDPIRYYWQNWPLNILSRQ